MKAEQLQTMTFKITGGSAVCLNSRIVVQQALREIAWRAGLSAVRSVSHDYAPYGIGVALLLPEAHIAARTWPETGLAYVTMTTCQPVKNEMISSLERVLGAAFVAEQVETGVVNL